MPDIWYVAHQGQQEGPMSASEVLARIESGTLDRSSHAFRQGMTDWAPIASQAEFATAFAGAGEAPPPPPPRRGRADEIDYEIFGHEMQLVEITLDPQEACIAEAGSFLYMDPGIDMQTIFGDGSAAEGGGLVGKLMTAGKRVLTGESLFLTVFGNTAASRQKVAFASPYPGGILAIDLPAHDGELLCQKDAFLCAAKGVSVGVAFHKRLGAGLFGGEGFILQRLEGDGLCFVHAGGMVMERQLAAGETLRLDTGCLVAFERTVDYDIQMVSGIRTALFGGEGLFYAALTGPGRVWIQSLPFSRLASRVYALAPQTGGKRRGEGSVLGGLGDLVMGD